MFCHFSTAVWDHSLTVMHTTRSVLQVMGLVTSSQFQVPHIDFLNVRCVFNYHRSFPGCIYGDPHIVTTDGLKYTFNGKGEFILIETMDKGFTLQGRMIEAIDEFGSVAAATVFSAIVGKQNDSDTGIHC